MEFLVMPPSAELVLPLWQEAFGDSQETVCAIVRAIEKHSKLFLAKDGNVPVSMLFAVRERVGEHTISYIYAVATKKSHRGQGLAAKLLSFAEQHLQDEGVSACLLSPAEQSLIAYYARLGYSLWSAAGRDVGNENTAPAAIRNLHESHESVLAMAKIFDPQFPKNGTFRYAMG